MKLASYFVGEKREWGILSDARVISCGDIARSLEQAIAGGVDLDTLEARARDASAKGHALSEVRLDAPLRRPGKIVAIGLNYRDHCRETGTPEPEKPIVFTKFTTSVVGPHDEVRWSRDLTDQVDWEVELGVVIGRPTRHVSVENALDYVFGYTVVNDVSARDLQSGDGQWVRAKSLDTFCPMGPSILTADEVPDLQALDLGTWVNGRQMQGSNTKEMIFGVAFLISYLSQAFTLKPGDVIATGTPHGVGLGMDPKVFLNDGDVVEVEVEKIGRLKNRCRIEG